MNPLSHLTLIFVYFIFPAKIQYILILLQSVLSHLQTNFPQACNQSAITSAYIVTAPPSA